MQWRCARCSASSTSFEESIKGGRVVTWLGEACCVISSGDVSCLTLEDVVLNEGIVVCDGLVAATLIQKTLDLDYHLPRGLHPLWHAAVSCCGATCRRLCFLLSLLTKDDLPRTFGQACVAQ